MVLTALPYYCPKCGRGNAADALECAGCKLGQPQIGWPQDALIDTVLDDKFHLMRRLGHGGFGTVYRAVVVATGQECALKILRSELAHDGDAVQRFRQEASVMNKLADAENVVQFIDFGQLPTGEFYMAMEFVEGQTLGAVLKREGPLDIHRALRIARAVAIGLRGAEDAGVLHRDLKPDNIILTWHRFDGEGVKILDFGIARLMERSTQMTATGMAIGTPPYMSWEQWMRREDLDIRSDLYALGVLLYRMLSGVLPYPATGDSPIAIYEALKNETATQVGELRAELPVGLAALVHRMLARDRDQRPFTAREVVDELDLFLIPPSDGVDTAQDHPSNAPTAKDLPAPLAITEAMTQQMAAETKLLGEPLTPSKKLKLPKRRKRRSDWVTVSLIFIVFALASVGGLFAVVALQQGETPFTQASDRNDDAAPAPKPAVAETDPQPNDAGDGATAIKPADATGAPTPAEAAVAVTAELGDHFRSWSLVAGRFAGISALPSPDGPHWKLTRTDGRVTIAAWVEPPSEKPTQTVRFLWKDDRVVRAITADRFQNKLSTEIWSWQGDTATYTRETMGGNPFHEGCFRQQIEWKGDTQTALCLDTDGAQVDFASGAPVRTRTFEGGALMSVEWRDNDGKPSATLRGVHRRTFTRDDHGCVVRETTYGIGGTEMIDASSGAAVIETQVDPHCRPRAVKLLGVAGIEARDARGVHLTRYLYNPAGHLVARRLLDVGEKPVTAIDDVASEVRYQVNAKGQRVARSYFGPGGVAVERADGVHRVKYTYGDDGLVKTEAYFDASDNKKKYRGAVHAYHNEYNTRGWLEMRRSYNIWDQPVAAEGGHHSIRYEYDVRGRITTETCLNRADNPAPCFAERSAGVRNVWTDSGLLAERVYIDIKGRNFRTPGGYTRRVYAYDTRGRQVSMTWYDGDRVVAPNDGGVAGYAKARILYTDAGAVAACEYEGTTSRPARARLESKALSRVKIRASRVEFVYDDAGRLLRQRAYLPGSDEPHTTLDCSATPCLRDTCLNLADRRLR